MDKKLYSMMDWARIEQIVYSEEDDPDSFLGAHIVPEGLLVQCFFPGADKCEVILKINDTEKSYNMDLMDDEGFFACLVRNFNATKFSYKYKVISQKETKYVEDPYRFKSVFNDRILCRFSEGWCYDIYEYLGAHPRRTKGTGGINFAVWAPNAVRVSVVGDFNGWDGRCHQMKRIKDSGIFEIFIPGVNEGAIYKYEIKLKGGMVVLKSDPYGFASQVRPENASIVASIDGYSWQDEEFVSSREAFQSIERPMSIYEIHLGSFDKPENGREFYSYRELADKIVPYVKDMGYTHVELMPVMEHPLDESWGYQVIGYYSPTSRYGTPEDFMYFVDRMHQNGIGVILDWVPAHFPRDVHGLSNFDGTSLYEDPNPIRGNHPDWGTLVFDYGKKQVSNYLIANALFWINKYHADGLRIDAVASLICLDYGRENGRWERNIYGTNENLEAVELIKHLNSINKKMNTGALIIAEDSTAWPKVTGKPEDGGLGFDYKWNMGWMNDFLSFMRLDPLYRSGHYNELTFSMIYTYSEKFILSFSHDEVVHGKSSLLGKMPGERERKFANLRTAFAYMYTHPGKKLLFMGQDIGRWDEWSEKSGICWGLLEFAEHRNINNLVRALNSFYRSNPALYECDNSSEGFEWINNISANETIIVFLRKDKAGNNLLVVCNFADADRSDYKIGVPFSGKYKEVFSTEYSEFGGRGGFNPRVKRSREDECDGRRFSVRINVPALSVSIFSCEFYEPEDLKYYHAPSKKRKRSVGR